MAVPKPVNVNVVCSECGLPWAAHKENQRGKVTLDECVRLLKIEMKRPYVLPNGQPTVNPWHPRPFSGGGSTWPTWDGTKQPSNTSGTGLISFTTTSSASH